MYVHAHIVYTSFMYMYSTIYIYMTWSNLAEIHTEESVLAAPPRNIEYIVHCVVHCYGQLMIHMKGKMGMSCSYVEAASEGIYLLRNNY